MTNLGAVGEQIAAHFLLGKGYEIVMQNYWTRVGEIDIIARNREFIIFVEVKTKSNINFGKPHEQVTKEKLRRMISACRLYCQEHGIGDKLIRIDVISIHCDKESHQANIKHFEGITA